MSRLSRRSLLAGTSAVGVAALAACSDSDSAGTTAGSTSTASATDGVTVDTLFGPIAVPADPQAVVALGWGDMETCLALGTQVVGTSDWLAYGGDGVGPWAQDLVTQTPEQLGTLELSYEAVAALTPDLILDTRSDNTTDKHDKLQAIAATVGPPPGLTQLYGTSWQDQVKLVAAALAKDAEGATLISDLEAQFAEVAAANPQFAGKTVTVGTFYAGGWGAYVTGDGRVDFMESLGFTANPQIEALKGDSFSVSLSAEQLSLLEADLVVVFPIGASAAEITANPVLQALPATRAGRLVVLDDTTLTNAFSSATTLGLAYALENAVPLFAAAVPA